MHSNMAKPYQAIVKFSKFIQQAWSELFSPQKISLPAWQDLQMTCMIFK